MFPDKDAAYLAAKTLVTASPEELETHAIAQALRLNQAGAEFVEKMGQQLQNFAPTLVKGDLGNE